MRTRHSLLDDLIARRWDDAAARRVLDAWRRSGLPLSAFARRHGVQAQRLGWWRKHLGDDSASGAARAAEAVRAFVRARVVGSEAAVTVRLPGGAALEIADATAVTPAWVAAVVREIASGS